MLTNLIAILLKAKAGAISGVFLLGATGALISVSASNGVTTVTITEASPSPSASASPSASTSPTAAPTASPTASPKPSSSPSTAPAVAAPNTTDCSAEAKALALQVKRVDSAFNGFHSQLEKARKDGNKEAIQKADKALKEIRKAAVKAIHATATCKDDDEDEDKDEKSEKDEDKDEDDAKAVTAPVTPVAAPVTAPVTAPVVAPVTAPTTAAGIADAAIAQMKTVFDGAKLTASAANTHKPEDKKPEDKKPESKKSEDKKPEAQKSGEDKKKD